MAAKQVSRYLQAMQLGRAFRRQASTPSTCHRRGCKAHSHNVNPAGDRMGHRLGPGYFGQIEWFHPVK